MDPHFLEEFVIHGHSSARTIRNGVSSEELKPKMMSNDNLTAKHAYQSGR